MCFRHQRSCRAVQMNTYIPRQRTESQLTLGATRAGQNEKRETEYTGNRKYGGRG
jgi:hypothetical protein